MEQIQLLANEARLREEAETSYAIGTDDEEQFNQSDDNSCVDENLNTCVNCSGLSRMTISTRNASVQTEDVIVSTSNQVTSNQVSTACGLSVEMARIAV